jgi:hypothetical protein
VIINGYWADEGLDDPGFGGVEVDCVAPVDVSGLPEGGIVAALAAGFELSCCSALLAPGGVEVDCAAPLDLSALPEGGTIAFAAASDWSEFSATAGARLSSRATAVHVMRRFMVLSLKRYCEVFDSRRLALPPVTTERPTMLALDLFLACRASRSSNERVG